MVIKKELKNISSFYIGVNNFYENTKFYISISFLF